MSTKKNIDHATAQLPDPIDTPAQMVAAGNKHIPAIKNSPEFANAPEVETAVGAWEVENTNLEDANQKVVDADLAAALARQNQQTIARRWRMRAQGCITAINVYADGSKDIVGKFAMNLATRNEPPLATVPEELRGVRVKESGTAAVRWKTTDGNHGFMLQHATNPNDPTTISAPFHCTAGKFKLPEQTPGATVYFRVAACDSRLPGNQTPYTPWLAVTVPL